jgi:hypothetical protein
MFLRQLRKQPRPATYASHATQWGGGGEEWKVRGKNFKGGYTLVTLPRIVTPYRVSVDETRDSVTYQKLVTR